MDTATAIALIENLIYKPSWRFECADHTKRFEGTIKVTIHYPANQSERRDAPEGYPNEIEGGTHASFPILCAGCNSDVELYRQLLEHVIKVETHEAREFLRTKPTFWAPFHPHRHDGMQRWGDVEGDLKFGVM